MLSSYKYVRAEFSRDLIEGEIERVPSFPRLGKKEEEKMVIQERRRWIESNRGVLLSRVILSMVEGFNRLGRKMRRERNRATDHHSVRFRRNEVLFCRGFARWLISDGRAEASLTVLESLFFNSATVITSCTMHDRLFVSAVIELRLNGPL